MPYKDPDKQREYLRRHREANRTKERARQRCHYAANREKERARKRRYREEDPEKGRAYQRRWHEENPEYHQQHRATNSAKYRQYRRRWRKDNPAKERAKSARRRARKAKATIGDPTKLREREAEIRTEPCTHCGTRDRIEIDHIVPLSKGGSHAADNLQALCRSCNASKGARH